MAEKRFPASEIRLRKLRAVGIFPRSGFFQLAAIGAAVALLSELIPQQLARQFPLLRDNFSKFSLQSTPEAALAAVGEQLFLWSVLLVLPIVGWRVLVGVVETRGGVWWGRISPRFGRLLPGGRNIRSADVDGSWWQVSGGWRLIGMIAGITAMLAVFYLSLVWFSERLGGMLLDACCQNGTAQAHLPPLLRELIQRPILALSGTLVFLGVVGHFAAQLIFRKEQMMTRDELMAEAREQEGSEFARRTLASGRSELP